nr:tail fiber protein [Kineococcus vitellinus]
MDAIVPVGVPLPWPSQRPVPPGYIAYQGQTLERTLIPRLAAFIGGSGATVTLPDYTGLVLRGGKSVALGTVTGRDDVTLTEAQLAPHEHPFTGAPHDHGINDPQHAHRVNNDYGLRVMATAASSTQYAARAEYGNQAISPTIIQPEPTGIDIQPATAGGTVGRTGGGQPVSIIPKSRVVVWMTRAV